MTRHGCCVDFGASPDSVCEGEHAQRCMNLPDKKTCSDCAHLPRCESFGFTSSATNDYCSFHPRRFKEKR